MRSLESSTIIKSRERQSVVGTTSMRPANMMPGGNTGAIGVAGDGSSSSGRGPNNHSLDVEQRYVKRVASSFFWGATFFSLWLFGRHFQ